MTAQEAMDILGFVPLRSPKRCNIGDIVTTTVDSPEFDGPTSGCTVRIVDTLTVTERRSLVKRLGMEDRTYIRDDAPNAFHYKAVAE
jgi:hypothetical protein